MVNMNRSRDQDHGANGRGLAMTDETLVGRSLQFLSAEQRLFIVAFGTVLDRMKRLNDADSADLFEFLRDYKAATTDEEREAAYEAMEELLGASTTTICRLNLAEDEQERSGKLQNWINFVSQLIRDYRKKAGLTQEQLAEKAGLPQSHISRIENGKHSPSNKTQQKIAEAYGVPVSEFDPSS